MFNLFKRGLEKTASSLKQAFTHKKLDDSALEDLEDALIMSDMGAATAAQLVAELKQQKFPEDDQMAAAQTWLANAIIEKIQPIEKPFAHTDNKPELILFVGVNGAGKTTTIAKLTQQFQNEGKKVLLAAADTFRAGAVDQLGVWAERTGAPLVRPAKHNADPAGVVYQALEKAQNDDFDIVLADTAGRLQNHTDLMAQLEKIVRVVKKHDDNAPHQVLLVLDATVGQNALEQAKAFTEMVGVTGLIITKLDSSAKAGVLVPLAEKTNLPVHFIGLGERVNDLMPFNAEDYAKGLIGLDD